MDLTDILIYDLDDLNRTIVECKLNVKSDSFADLSYLNRTIVECKFQSLTP